MREVQWIGSTMTVQEVIDELQKVADKSSPVITEGCDCNGSVVKVEVDDDGDVLLRRRNG